MSDGQFVCPLCGASTGRIADVASHVRAAHDGSSIADVLRRGIDAESREPMRRPSATFDGIEPPHTE